MHRMSVLDAGFYLVDHQNVPMHLGSVAIFEGPAPGLADVAALYSARLCQVPRYRQVVRTSPLQLRRPVWEDDRAFDVSDHVRHASVVPPGDAAQLSDLAAEIFAEPLDPRRPLWEAWLLEGLAEGRWALLSKVHHCMVDGIGGSELMSIIFGPEPVSPVCAAAEGTQGQAENRADAVARPLRQVAEAIGTVIEQLPASRDALSYGRGLAHGARRLVAPSASSLNGPAGTRRRWAWTSFSLDEARRIRAALGGTVNDVLLAAITGGFRDLMTETDLARDVVVRSLVPVSVRTASEAGDVTNRLSAVLVNLPVGEPKPTRRLEIIRAQTSDLKRTHQAAGPGLITAMLEPVAPPLLAFGLRAAFRLPQPVVQTVTTNVPGPREPLSALGRPMIAAYPFAPVGGNVRISVATYSYLDVLYFGITTDYDAVADPGELARVIDRELAILGQLATPARSRCSGLRPAS